MYFSRIVSKKYHHEQPGWVNKLNIQFRCMCLYILFYFQRKNVVLCQISQLEFCYYCNICDEITYFVHELVKNCLDFDCFIELLSGKGGREQNKGSKMKSISIKGIFSSHTDPLFVVFQGKNFNISKVTITRSKM